MTCAIVSIDFFKETFRCAFLETAAKLVQNECFTKRAKLPCSHIAHSWQICIMKHQNLFIFSYKFPFFCGITLLFFFFSKWLIHIITTMDVHYQVYHPCPVCFLYNLTHILRKSIYKEKCRRIECFHYLIFYQNRFSLGVNLQFNKRTCYHLSILIFFFLFFKLGP